MEDLNEGIVEQYAGHLLKRASSVVVSFALVGTIGGAALGAAPGLMAHSFIPGGAKYFAVLLGAIAGGCLGRTIGDRRAVGLRLQAQMALRLLKLESRFVTAPAAPAARPAAPAPVSAAAATPVPPAAPPALRPPAPAPAQAPPPAQVQVPVAVTAAAVTPPVTPPAQALPPLSASPS
jgi:hypothetical protein